MKRLVALAVLSLVLAAPAQADDEQGATFVIVEAPAPVLPSAETPNGVAVAMPPPPLVPQQLSVEQLTELWGRAGEAYGIPWQVLAAINKIESNFGQNMGPSSAGAVGWMQFMPDTWMRWGLDADGDGVANPWVAEDAVFASARYLAAAGGRTDIPRAVFAYNHAQWYVDDVLELASAYARGSVEMPVILDGLQADLVDAQLGLAEIGEELAVALEEEERLARAEELASQRSDRITLLSDSLLANKQAVLIGVRHEEATVRVERLREQLAAAEEAVSTARAGTLSSPFAFGAAVQLLPETTSGYAFPVGGGAATVSVAAHHHDYPAADIVAPEGAPVFAHTGGIVVRGWSSPEGRCGIGFTMRAEDGRSWTYCHFSYLEPAVTAGAALAPGAPVGLVGSTGTTSSGPHLHLQLAPPVSYPQAEPWFQQFAGTAFSWQGEAPTASGPVFVVVDDEQQAEPEVVLFTQSP